MRKIKDGWFLLNAAELDALTEASIDAATRELHMEWYDPKNPGLPAIVNEAYGMLHVGTLYNRCYLAGELIPSTDKGLVENPDIYQAVRDAFKDCAVDVHAVYTTDKKGFFLPGWYLAAVDLFRPVQTYKVYFSYEGKGRVVIEDIIRWKFG